MKKCTLFLIFLVMCGCTTAEVKKEYPAKLKLDKYKTIQLGWIHFPPGLWRQFGFKKQAEWQKATYQLNAVDLKKYFRKALPGNRKILGPSRGNPRRGDLLIKFDYLSYEAKFVAGATTPDRLNLRVEMYDVRKGRKIYTAVPPYVNIVVP